MIHEDCFILVESEALLEFYKYISPHTLVQKWSSCWAVFDGDQVLIQGVFDKEKAVMNMCCVVGA